jgi:uncharacterized protein YdaT
MSTVTLLDEIDDLERLLAGAQALISTSSRPGEWLRVADEDEEDDLFGEDDLGFDDVDEEDADEDDDDLAEDDDDLAEDLDDEL